MVQTITLIMDIIHNIVWMDINAILMKWTLVSVVIIYTCLPTYRFLKNIARLRIHKMLRKENLKKKKIKY